MKKHCTQRMTSFDDLRFVCMSRKGQRHKKKLCYPRRCDETPLTSSAEGAVVGGIGAVAQVAVVLLHALASVAAVHPVTGAVALAAGLDPRRYFRPLLKVQRDAVHPQGTDTAQEAPLPTCGA